MPATDFLIFGRVQPPADLLPLCAGRLAMLFDPETISLRRICLEDREVIRGIYAAVRDQNWGTVPPFMKNLNVTSSADSFRLTFDVSCQQDGIDLFWRGEISGKADGTVRFKFDGEARSTFLRNRIGLCVLHPIRECSGARASFARKNAWKVELAFPKTIDPQIRGEANFCDMQMLAHEVRPGVWAKLVFEGEIFEMEDQRNWTDASFKTYGTPLTKPFPVEIQSGTRVGQSVTLSLIKDPTEHGQSTRATPPVPRATAPDANAPLELPARPAVVLPHLGLGCASHGHSPGALELQRLAALRLSHLRADLKLADSSWTRTLASAAGEARAAEIGLELALHLPAAEIGLELASLRDLLHQLSIVPARVMAFRQGEEATSAAALKQVREGLHFADVPVGGGSNAHFCELNRARALGDFNPAAADFVCWPMTSQVHAFDDRSILETLEAQPDTVVSARAFAEGRPLVVSPVMLKPRFNAVATAGEEESKPGELPSRVDPRQMSLFNAAWTLGSVAALTAAGVESATYFETTGWCGVMETRAGSPLPEKFPSIPGAVFPVYFVFAALAGFRRTASLAGADPRTLAALVLFDGSNRRRVLLGNLNTNDLVVRLSVGGSPARGWLLDETNVERAMREPESFLVQGGEWRANSAGVLDVVLKRHALAWLDLK
jgi:hypothetical protein